MCFQNEIQNPKFFQIPKIIQNEFQNLKIFKTCILGGYGPTMTYACRSGANFRLGQKFTYIEFRHRGPKCKFWKIFGIWNSFWNIFGIWKIFGFWIPFWKHNSNYRSLGHEIRIVWSVFLISGVGIFLSSRILFTKIRLLTISKTINNLSNIHKTSTDSTEG